MNKQRICTKWKMCTRWKTDWWLFTGIYRPSGSCHSAHSAQQLL